MDLVNASQSVCTEDFKHLQWFKDKILRLEVPYTALRFTLGMGWDHGNGFFAVPFALFWIDC